MCGIAGIIQHDDRPVDVRLLEAMTRALAHRGPDGEGYVLLDPSRKAKAISTRRRLSDSVRTVLPGYSVGLGHRRLAILDRSPLGHQPMSSADELVWIAYNGEIYNYRELRDELRGLGWRFRSMTDTEVILHAYLQWGPDCLPRLNGMFAFSIWDGRLGHLFCARDRLGMKPFYYRLTGGRLSFASEIKALLKDANSATSPNHRMIHDFLAFGLQDHSTETFFEDIQQLRPGHCLFLKSARVEIKKWWDVEKSETETEAFDDSAVQSFRVLFEDAVRLHLRSDVSVGSCLSGGLDSSSIVCTIAHLLEGTQAGEECQAVGQRLKTFSSCFEDPGCDERPYLNAVVARAGTQSVEVFPDIHRLFEDMPRILWFQEEPFGGTSYLAQWAVMRAAAENGVTVLLDGQGGDELLCGYPGYWGSHVADLVSTGNIGGAFHEMVAYGRQRARIHPTVWSNFARAVLPARFVAQAQSVLKGIQRWMHPDFAVRYADRAKYLVYDQRFPTALENHVAAYLQTHSLPALLHHEDRNSMAFSIEARLPFLDARLVEFLFRLPASLKLRKGWSKVILREALGHLLPAIVKDRTDKMGFATPQARWLREDLRSDLEHLFDSPAFAQRGWWEPSRLRNAYRGFCEGRARIDSMVWRWVCLELWHRRFFQ